MRVRNILQIYFQLNFAKYAGLMSRIVSKKFVAKKRTKMDVR